jgi:hypothetical protein
MSLLARLGRIDGKNKQVKIFASHDESQDTVEESSYQAIKHRIHQLIVDDMTPEEQRILSAANHDSRQIEAVIYKYCQRVIENEPFAVPRGHIPQLVADIRDEMLGLGPIQSLLNDDSITEVMVNGPQKVFVERLGKLELTDDVIVHLYNQKREEDPQEFRVVKARFKAPTNTARKSPKGANRKKTEQDVYFITNVTNEPGKLQLSAQEIAEAYRRRWDIEVFYRFLKQELSFSHFLSTSDNGIKVILYMTLITAMLIMIYKRLNGIGYSDAKFCFKLQLEDWIIDLNVAIKTSGPEYKKAMQAVRNRIP